MDQHATANMSPPHKENKADPQAPPAGAPDDGDAPAADSDGSGSTREYGGPAGPEPTRFGDWERKGRCVDF